MAPLKRVTPDYTLLLARTDSPLGSRPVRAREHFISGAHEPARMAAGTSLKPSLAWEVATVAHMVRDAAQLFNLRPIMAFALTGNGLWLLIAVVMVAGLAAGFLSGLLGIGGGGILVPVLYEAFGVAGVTEDVRMHMALGTTLAVIAPTVLRSVAAHRARGAVDMGVVIRIGPWVALGVVAGTLIAKGASSEALRWVWVVCGSLLALKMALGRDHWRLADTLPRAPFLEAIAVVIGIASTLMGIGGATFTVPLLTLHGRPLLQSVATASGIGPIIAVPGLIGYIWSGWGTAGLPPYSLGYVSLAAVLIMPLGVLAAPYGVRVAHGIDKRKLELAFAAFISCVAARFLWSLS